MRIFGKVLGVLYAIIFTFLLLGLSLVISCTNLFNGKSYKNIIKNMDLDSVQASELGLSDDSNASLKDVLVDEISEIGISKEAAEKIIDNDEIKDVAGNLMEKIVDYSTKGGEVPQVDKKDIESILDNEEVKSALGDDYSEKDINELVDEVNDALEDLFKEGSELDD